MTYKHVAGIIYLLLAIIVVIAKLKLGYRFLTFWNILFVRCMIFL